MDTSKGLPLMLLSWPQLQKLRLESLKKKKLLKLSLRAEAVMGLSNNA